MKKIFLIVAVLMLATPALAVDVDIWAEQGDDVNKVEIWYEVTPVPDCPDDGNRPRAFGLNIVVTDGNIIDIDVPFEGECDDVNRGFGIFPGTITISGGVPGPWGTPVASGDAPGAEDTGLDTNTIVVEMGSLYTGANCPDPCAMLFTFTVNMDCCVSITGNAARTGEGAGSGVVLENLGAVTVDYTGLCVDNVSRFVPDVVGELLADANGLIEAEDLVVGNITWVCDLTYSYGEVTMTDPEALTEVEQGSTVHIWVSQGDCDFGDANDLPYPTLLARNGARHIATGVILGVNRDTEADGQPSPNADLDDNTGAPDDEDDVTPILITPVGGAVTVTVTGGPGYLNAWIDFNDNGNWDDPGEQIFTDEPLPIAVNPLTFTVPAYALRETDLVSRWRVTSYNTLGTLSYTGLATDGEVEDHIVQVVCHVPDVVGEPNLAAQAELIANGFEIGDVTAECNDTIADGNVISTNPAFCNYPGCDTAVDIVVSTGPCEEEECFPDTHDDYDQWIKAGLSLPGVPGPNCWCSEIQCYGDVDGQQVVTKAGSWYVNFEELNYLNSGWQVADGQPGNLGGKYQPFSAWVCADFDHVEVVTKAGTWRVDFEDLNILNWNWQNDNAPVHATRGPLSNADCLSRGY